MVSQEPAALGRILNAVNCPGGFARQFRVQYQEPRGHEWQMYATFSQRKQAEQCLSRLKGNGVSARVVDYRLCPVAG